LAQERPKAVGLLTDISSKNYTELELARIVEALKAFSNVVVGYTDDESFGEVAPNSLLSVAKVLPGFISQDTFSYGADSVSRRVMITIDGMPTLYAELARVYHGKSELPSFRGSHLYADGANSLQTYIAWEGRSATHQPISTDEIIRGKTVKKMEGKIVLLGTHLHQKRSNDHILTPFSRKPFTTSSLEGAAAGLATLLDDKGIVRCPDWISWILSAILTVGMANLVLFLPPGKGILIAISAMLGLFGFSSVLLFSSQLWLPLAHPLALICFGYYLVIPYRLVNEYRKRWHYQEKSELMVELEQLKSNFLSFVSHDLKTPIARIQGNAELLLSENKALSTKQRKSVSAIIQTSDDLSQYVETILDLTRIESAKVPINRMTRDINSTILDVVESRKFMATERQIVVATKLEPIFSFKFDVTLIKRALQNLLENAIKYSPTGSSITFASKEDVNWIRVSVQDQGIGISAEEKQKIFTKFYRCDNDTTKVIKGTGLGLYLVKYFIELHQGQIDLVSQPGEGSTFTVSLPVIT